jgi:hypothetical protein
MEKIVAECNEITVKNLLREHLDSSNLIYNRTKNNISGNYLHAPLCEDEKFHPFKETLGYLFDIGYLKGTSSMNYKFDYRVQSGYHIALNVYRDSADIMQ